MQNSIQITNAIQLSTPYLNRFFSKAGPIQHIKKDQIKQLVYISFKSKNSVQKAFQFNKRVLDKKPIVIRKHNQLNILSDQSKQQKMNIEKPKNNNKNTKILIQDTISVKLPCLHQINNSDIKLPIRSQYRLIQHSDLQDNQIIFQNNPLQGMKSKRDLWKIIIDQITKHIKQFNPINKQLILSCSFCIWTLIQLKLQQIAHLLKYNQNQKSKYIENFIQDILINKLNVLKNPNIINNSNKYKTITTQNLIELSFETYYPHQSEQQQKFYCESNEKVYKILCAIYYFSPLLGKIYHELHTNSLILYQKRQTLQKIVDSFLDKPSLFFNKTFNKLPNPPILIKNSTQFYQRVQNLNSQINELNFNGFIENYGNYLFINLIPCQRSNNWNSLIWLQMKNNKIQGQFSHPNFYNCSMLFSGCSQRSLIQLSFYNLYSVNPYNLSVQKQQQHKFEQNVIIYEDGQFSVDDMVQNTINFIRYQIRKIILQQRVQQKKIDQSLSQNLIKNYQSIICLHSQQQQQQNQNQTQSTYQKIKLSLDIFYVGVNLIIKQKQIIKSYNQLTQYIKKIQSYFVQNYYIQSPQIKYRLSLIELIPQKQNQFNAYKCQNYLIHHIDKHILGKNSIIASQQFAQKVAQKLLQQASGNQLYGIKDKKYIGSQIWRLYNKSGSRRAKMKISQYNLKKRKSQ